MTQTQIVQGQAVPRGFASCGSDMDSVLAQWEAIDKSILIVAATKTGGQDTDLPFAEVDGKKVGSVFGKLGYKDIGTLVGKDATRENFVQHLKQIRNIGENGLVVVYYSGHGARDAQGRDLWLQLSGQKYFGEAQGLSVSELVNTARGGGTYKGQLVVLIDACYSGEGAWSRSLNLGDMEKTLIFASSSRAQASLVMELSPKERMSAFTYYLLRGLTDDWERVDDRHDGIIQYDDLRTYIERNLTEELLRIGLVNVEMTPDIAGTGNVLVCLDPAKFQHTSERIELFNARMRRHVLQLTTQSAPASTKSLPNKTEIVGGSMEKRPANADSPLTSQTDRSLSMAMPRTVQPSDSLRDTKRSQAVAPSRSDPYASALRAIALEQYEEALALLDEAEKTGLADLSEVYAARGEIAISRDSLAAARNWYEKAIAASKSDSPDLFERASLAFYSASDVRGAERLANRALEIRKTKRPGGLTCIARDLFLIGMYELVEGRLNNAERFFTQAASVESNPSDENADFSLLAPVLLATTNLSLGDPDAAQRIADQLNANYLIGKSPTIQVQALILQLSVASASSKGDESRARTTISSFLDAWSRQVAEGNVDAVQDYVGSALGVLTVGSEVLKKDPQLLVEFNSVCRNTIALFEKNLKDNSISLAWGFYGVAGILVTQRQYASAEELYKRAEDVSLRSAQRNSLLLNCSLALGQLFTETKEYAKAEKEFNTALALAKEVDGGDGYWVFNSVLALSRLYDLMKRSDASVDSYRLTLEIARRIWGSDGAVVASTMEELGDVLRERKDYAQAEQLYKQCIEISERMEPRSDELSRLYVTLGSLYFAEEKYRAAEGAFKRSVELDGDAKESKASDSITSLLWLAETLRAQHRTAQTTGTLSKVFSLLPSQPAETIDTAVKTMLAVANEYDNGGKTADADRLYDQILTIYRDDNVNRRAFVAIILYNLAYRYESRSDRKTAEQLFQRAINIDENVFGNDDAEVARDLEALAELYRRMGKYEEAVRLYSKSIPIWERSGEKIKLAISLTQLGSLYVTSSKYSEAQPLLLRAKNTFESESNTENPNFADCLVWLSVVYFVHTQELPKAEVLLRQALAIDQHGNTINPSAIATDLRLLAGIFRFQLRNADSEKLLRQALEALKKDARPDEVEIAKVNFSLALLYHTQQADRPAEKALGNLQRVAKLTTNQKAEIADWLVYTASMMRYMKRVSDADVMDVWAAAVHKSRR